MDCFHDFCLACDKESNGAYCSQTCRMADLERASPAATTSSMMPSQVAQSRLSLSSLSTTSGSAYMLQPAYDFLDRNGSHSAGSQYQPQTSYFMRHPTEQPSRESERSLTPSTSRSSLSSTTSNASTTPSSGMSQQSQHELTGYFHSFSRSKGPQRRSTMK